MLFNSLAADVGFAGVSRKEVPSAHNVPYLRHVSDEIVKTKNGQYIAVIRLGGYSFQTADNRTLNTLLEQRNTFVRALASSQWAIYTHIVRKRIDPQLDGNFQNSFSRYVNERYLDVLRQRTMFTNEIYLSIVRKASVGRMGAIENVINLFRGAGNSGARAEIERERIDDLREVVTRLKEQLAGYSPRVLSVVVRDGRFFSEPSEFFSQLLNGPHDIQLPLPRMGLDSYLPTHRPIFEGRAFVLQGRSMEDSWYASMLSIKEYPVGVVAGLLDRLLKLPREFILTQSYSVIERDAARGSIEKQGGQLAAGDDAGTVVTDQIALARNRLMGGEATYGTHHLTVMCLARDVKGMEKAVDEVATGLSEVGIVPVREDVNAEYAYWAQLPGNADFIARGSMISSLELCGLSSLHNYPSGERKRLRWKTPVTLLETKSSTPYFFSFHESGGERPPGNFILIGPTGTGKTVAQGFLIAQLERVSPAPHIAFFDKDRGGEIMIRALGGYYETLRTGEPTGFNPFQIDNTAKNRDFLFELVQYMCLEESKTRLSSEDEDTVRESITTIMGYERGHRTLGNFHQLLQGRASKTSGDIGSRFYDWVDPQRRGWLFNNAEDTFATEPRIIGFDMTEILDKPRERTACLMYIFHRCEAKLREDGVPAAYFIDEAWKFLRDPYFSAFITDKMKTIRKLNGVIGLGTQSGSDITSSADASTLIQQTQTKVFFANPDADEEVHRGAFRLTAAEMEWLSKTDKSERSFLIKHGNDSVVAKLDLRGMPDVLKVLSSDKDSIAEMDRLRAEFGDDPDLWLPKFLAE